MQVLSDKQLRKSAHLPERISGNKMANIMMIFKLLVVLGAAKPPKPLNWTPGMTPQIHNMFKTIDGQSLDIILTSAPVLRLKAIEHEIQLKCFEQVVDLTQPGRFAHNLRREVRSLRESEIRLKSDYKSLAYTYL